MARSTKKRVEPVPKAKRTESYWQALNEIPDPELEIGIVDLGLIYKVEIDKKGLANIYMSLTSPACPVGPQIVMQVEDMMMQQKGVKNVKTHIVWDPPWNQSMIDEDIRAMMW